MILIRCNAGVKIGMGHLVRCRVLAGVLKEREHRCMLVGPPIELRQETDDNLFEDWIERPQWQDDGIEADFHLKLAAKIGSRHMMVDDYRSSYDHQLRIRQAGIRIAQQYDASRAKRFAAHVVINSSPAERREDYEAGLYSPDIEMLHGPKHSVLRRDFLTTTISEPRTQVERILVTFGGGDDLGAVDFVLKSLQNWLPETITLVIVLGKHNPNAAPICGWIEDQQNQKQFELHVNAMNMSELMAGCDLAIMGGGTGTFEAAYSGLPMVLIAIAENQYKQCQGWESLDVATYLGAFGTVDEETLINCLNQLLNASKKRIAMSKQARKQVDGLGADRLIAALLDENKELGHIA